MSKDAIRSIQSGLAALGFNPGAFDGLDGPKTRAAALTYAQGKPATPAPLSPQTSAMIYQGAARHPVREIIVHCSATRPDWYKSLSLNAKRDEIRRWHTDPPPKGNGWKDIGYHWLIDRDGAVLSGRPETVIGSHVAGHNSGSIGICLIGGHGSSESDPFLRNFTAAQDVTLRQLIAGISARTRITKVSGHNQYAAKACPGFNVPAWVKEA